MRLVLLTLAALQFPVSGFARMTGIGTPIDDIASRGSSLPPETPMGYAFGIWFVIFSLSVIYAWRLPSPLPVTRQSLQLAGIFAASSLWMLSAQIFGDGWHLVFLILAMWFFSMQAFLSPENQSGDIVTRAMLGLYAGWLSVAIFLNITSTTAGSFGTFGLSDTIYALFTLFPAAALALAVLFKSKGDLWYAGAVLWALHAVFVANVWRIENASIAILSAVLFIATFVLALSCNNRLSRQFPFRQK